MTRTNVLFTPVSRSDMVINTTRAGLPALLAEARPSRRAWLPALLAEEPREYLCVPA